MADKWARIDAELKRLWADKFSMRKMAPVIGVTRNSIASRIRTLRERGEFDEADMARATKVEHIRLPIKRKTDWPDEQVETMRAMIYDGATHAEVSERIGRTKNAVKTKARSLGIRKPPPEKSRNQNRVKAPRHTRPPLKIANVIASAGLPPRPENLAVAQHPGLAAPDSRMLTFRQLRAGQCRFPIGDPRDAAFRFCGADAEDNCPYCATHFQIAYRPASERRREDKRLERAVRAG